MVQCEVMMRKLAGGNPLECGHSQVLSDHRTRLASAGFEQKPAWCVECEDWRRVIPQEVDTSDNDVLE